MKKLLPVVNIAVIRIVLAIGALFAWAPSVAYAASAGCGRINSASPDYQQGFTPPSRMSGVYTSRGNFNHDVNVMGWTNQFAPGDVISWSFTTSGTSPYVHIQLTDSGGTPYPSSALNRTGSGSGSFTVQTAYDALNLSAMPIRLDSGGNTTGADNPAMYNRTATITVSCTPAGSATPTVISLSPTTGSVLGGTSVTLTGTNLTGITSVSFGGTPATNFTGNTATSVTVRTPAHAAGAVNVVATASAGSTTVTNGFTYTKAAQTITFADPGAQNFGTTPILTASVSSGLALAFTSATTGVCTVSSAGVLTFVTVGTCTINADQAGDATYQAAATVSRSFTVNAVAPDAPTIGTATAGDGQATLTFTGPTNTGGAAITGYELTISPGNTVVTGASSPITIPNLTNGTAYSFTVKAINSAGSSPASAASNSVTPIASLAPPTVGAVTATVNANSSNNPITLVLSGGAATSVAVASAPRNGTATASGTGITYTPMTNYRGSDSFTYTATNASGTSAPATVTIDVVGQTAVITSHPQNLRVRVGSSATLTVTATNAVSYRWQARLPTAGYNGPYIQNNSIVTGAQSNSMTILSTLAQYDGYVFRAVVSGTDGQITYSNEAVLSVFDTPTITSVSPATGPAAGGTAITITGKYFLGATAVTIGGHPVTSFSVVSATSITAVVPAGTVGPADVVVINPDGTGTKAGGFTYQAPAVMISPVAGVLPGAVVGTAYSQTIAASGGTAPFAYAVTTGTLPAGLVLDSATGVIAGTPTTAGSYSFTVTVTDAANQTASAAYTLAVTVQAPVAGAVSTTVAANSTANAVTLALSGGTATSVAVATQPSH
ncbi:IPT/TIG domain-containing protein, partial [Sphingomonas sp. 1185]|uniref:beta strand repeat-containing protein n=1 Tax=Sphingomonas sp. 1185 TaxID=3156411 RepID=UPI00339271A1